MKTIVALSLVLVSFLGLTSGLAGEGFGVHLTEAAVKKDADASPTNIDPVAPDDFQTITRCSCSAKNACTIACETPKTAACNRSIDNMCFCYCI